MRKSLLLIIALFSAFLNVCLGQPFNEKIFYAGGQSVISPTDVIVDGNGYSCTLCDTRLSTKTDFIIQKTDFSGNLAMHKYYHLGAKNTDIEATKIVKTRDNGYIVVGYYTTLVTSYTVSVSAFATKLDLNGNFVWGKTYNSMTGSQPNSMGSLSRVNITPVVDDTSESYIITYCAMNDSTISYNGDVYIHALRIDKSGNLLWHNRYLPANRSSLMYTDIRDYASALTYANDGTKSMYFIGGTSELWTSAGYTDSLFLFGINKNGKIINNLRHYYVPTYPLYVSAIYDNTPGQSGLVLAYTMGNSIYPPGFSAAALTKMDLNFIISYTKAYITNDDHEFYATGITKTHDNHYAVSCWLESGSGPYQPTNAMLKTDQSGNPTFFKRYNILSFSKPGSDIISYFDAGGTNENYAMDGSYEYNSGANSTLRLLTTDPLGNTCGQLSDPVIPNLYSSAVVPMNYIGSVLQGSSSITFDSIPVPVTDTACDPQNPNFKPGLAIQNISQASKLSIYPTWIEEGNSNIHLDLDAGQPCMLNVALIAIDGRIIAQKQFVSAQGTSHLMWELPSLMPGEYIIKATSSDGSIQQTTKLTKL